MRGLKARMLSLTARLAVAVVLLAAMGDGVVAGADDDQDRRDTTTTLVAPKNRPDGVWDTLGGGGLLSLPVSRLELAAVAQPTPSICGDDRDSIIAEYQIRNIRVPLFRVPSCAELSNDVRSRYFTFDEYNYNGYHEWAWITTTLRRGMDQVREMRGAPLIMSSGYRCPEKNDDLRERGSVFDSLHQFGRAADIDIARSNLGEAEIEELVSAMQDEYENLDVDVKSDRIHFEWE